ncbi:hypothetical protein CURE108131_19145 [Cupriavidus respiraculi]|uniref:Uncharacterized protein n=1 Tax=Cupriavidus respiraculi TaxID=195930 RepID=A0ABM8XUG8_9BURK|nr:hypothetical protein [Cupriavidus respiraculi]MBY4949506.1 hypothetical protein [Cupriavidus respiraculi]CAG9183871.1 hypothetical protein LMG21510_04965 [Cupriavidus respiraculi]
MVVACIVLVLVLLAVVLWLYIASPAKRRMREAAATATTHLFNSRNAVSRDDGNSAALGSELSLVDADGHALVRTRVLQGMPEGAELLGGPGDVGLHRAQQLAADLFKGTTGLRSTTVELVFDPKIQEGLADGTLEIVKAKGGGARLMARATDSKKIAGHGRIVDAGRARQIAAGAFQLLSIAVAQSHLDHINRSLGDIKQGISDVRRYLGDQDHARLQGTVLYLEYLASLINSMQSPDDITPEKRHQLEEITREAMQWGVQLERQADALAKRIAMQKDQDTFGGTEHTYAALLAHAESAYDLVAKRNLLLRMMALLNLCRAYIDPLGKATLGAALAVGSADQVAMLAAVAQNLRDKSNQLLSKALWNRSDELTRRREDVIEKSERLLADASTQQRHYDSMMTQLAERLRRLQHPDGTIRIALTYDGEGQVQNAALL